MLHRGRLFEYQLLGQPLVTYDSDVCISCSGRNQLEQQHLFGPQCPTSPLLPPRKAPLEDLIYTTCTDPIPQPAAARTPRLLPALGCSLGTCLTSLFKDYIHRVLRHRAWTGNALQKLIKDSAVDARSKLLSNGGRLLHEVQYLWFLNIEKYRAPETDLFGPQCPTSPLLPPRKAPLEDLIYTTCTDPIPQPAAARTPRLLPALGCSLGTCLTSLFKDYIHRVLRHRAWTLVTECSSCTTSLYLLRLDHPSTGSTVAL
ncbi:putative 6-phosphogluconolactonase 1 [Dorcoceras hygrometricum]|uniref:Putative 6-phosphogluconolactonase 1 n=1 Tax=Dorcoceras hygrometricum TaxID=472368 RepID=A0A2Z7CJ62_9LAMI|nr:putative 6-phosphogluconolactonase 1 [Dorcoceras hygrometricum]